MSNLHNERKLGRAPENTRRYDLPLDSDSGTGFLILLTGLMTFLAVMALAGAFITGAVTKTWSSGLEGKLTIEIPAEKDDGTLRTAGNISVLAQRVEETLQKQDNIQSVTVLTVADIQSLIEPWLGGIGDMSALPLPGLISIELAENNETVLQNIRKTISDIAPDIALDTHEEWLEDLVRLTGSLQFAATLILLIVAGITIIAVTGAMQARMQIHKDDVELLHLMGADDDYIARQFQRHARIIAFKGSIAGVFVGMVILLFLSLITGQSSILPAEVKMSIFQIILIFSMPLPVCFLASLSVRHTVLRALIRMP